MSSTRLSTALASSSRTRITARSSLHWSRTYAVAPVNPHLASPSDSRVDVIRQTLYPADAVSPNSASPTGSRHPAHASRLEAVVPSHEAHETVERAWALFRRDQREARDRALAVKYAAMVEACEELDNITREAGSGAVPRAVYDRAMVRMSHASAAQAAAAQGISQGKKKTAESRFLEGRPEGVVPREAWVPTETRGKGWNYDWRRPSNE